MPDSEALYGITLILICINAYVIQKLFDLSDKLSKSDTNIILNKLFSSSNNHYTIEKIGYFQILRYYEIKLHIMYKDGVIECYNPLDYYYDHKKNMITLFTDSDIKNVKFEITVHYAKIYTLGKMYFHKYNTYTVYRNHYNDTDTLHKLLNIVVSTEKKYQFVEGYNCLVFRSCLLDGLPEIILDKFEKSNTSPVYESKYYI